jgi:hypothetical protein
MMMTDYSKMTDEDFDLLLEKRVSQMSAGEILSYGEVNMILREELNNEILEMWEREQELDEDDED